jgi:hypothetical protein
VKQAWEKALTFYEKRPTREDLDAYLKSITRGPRAKETLENQRKSNKFYCQLIREFALTLTYL